MINNDAGGVVVVQRVEQVGQLRLHDDVPGPARALPRIHADEGGRRAVHLAGGPSADGGAPPPHSLVVARRLHLQAIDPVSGEIRG